MVCRVNAVIACAHGGNGKSQEALKVDNALAPRVLMGQCNEPGQRAAASFLFAYPLCPTTVPITRYLFLSSESKSALSVHVEMLCVIGNFDCA